jgi:hypothetical protein
MYALIFHLNNPDFSCRTLKKNEFEFTVRNRQSSKKAAVCCAVAIGAHRKARF